ncbi:MAG: hypothetical protein ACK47E_09225 [Cyclobacteriaceae bacterium]|jgi:hypothetical protein
MSVNFFEAACQETTSELKFGLCDDQNGAKAYIDTTDLAKWVVTVENSNGVTVTFTAIDNCITIIRKNGDPDTRCDGMLTYGNNIIFVELKDQIKGWITHAVEQLESTINHFISNHDLNQFQHKRAFASNKRHPHFHVIDAEMKQRFFQKYKVRINIQATIII